MITVDQEIECKSLILSGLLSNATITKGISGQELKIEPAIITLSVNLYKMLAATCQSEQTTTPIK